MGDCVFTCRIMPLVYISKVKSCVVFPLARLLLPRFNAVQCINGFHALLPLLLPWLPRLPSQCYSNRPGKSGNLIWVAVKKYLSRVEFLMCSIHFGRIKMIPVYTQAQVNACIASVGKYVLQLVLCHASKSSKSDICCARPSRFTRFSLEACQLLA